LDLYWITGLRPEVSKHIIQTKIVDGKILNKKDEKGKSSFPPAKKQDVTYMLLVLSMILLPLLT